MVLLWSLKLGSKGIFSSPVQITSDSVLFCSLDGSYALIQPFTGRTKWLQKLNTPIFSTATKLEISNENLLVLAEVKGQISICKEENGERVSNYQNTCFILTLFNTIQITSFQTGGNIFSGLTLHQPDHGNHSLIIFGCHDKNVYCLKIEHETKELSFLNKFSLNAAVYSTPIIISKDSILACSTKGLMVLLDLQMSTILASYDLKAEVYSSPSCLRDKYVYIGCRDNYLYAFQL